MENKIDELIKKSYELLSKECSAKEISKEDKDEVIESIKNTKNVAIVATDESCIILGNNALVLSTFGALLQNIYSNENIPNDMIDFVISKAKEFSKMSEEQLHEQFITRMGDMIDRMVAEEDEKNKEEEKLQNLIDNIDKLSDKKDS